MPDPVRSSPLQNRHPGFEGWACVLAGAVGAGTILALIALRAIILADGLLALSVIGVTTFGLVLAVRNPPKEDEAEAKDNSQDLERRAALAGALEGLPDPLIVVTAPDDDALTGGRVAFSNAAARALLNIPSEGVHVATAVRHPEVLEIVDEALFGGISNETSYESGGAQERFWRAIARPLPTTDGSRMALLLLTDETDSRRNERMRADFLANASHELRTPLASLSGFIETLRGHAKDDPSARERFLEIMAAQADRMSRLVEDLMSLSRIELNEHIPPAGRVDVAMAVMDVVDALAPQAAGARVAIRPVLPPMGQAMITGDRDQIIQVIQNLVDNALKYAGDPGEVTVEVRTGLTAAASAAPHRPEAPRLTLLAPDRPQGTYVSLRVSDAGAGIPRQHLPRLTERFYRVEGQKSGDRSGTGLGLAIVKHIINRHRGGLVVEAAPGQGTTFLAYFPVCAGQARPAGATAGAASPALL